MYVPGRTLVATLSSRPVPTKLLYHFCSTTLVPGHQLGVIAATALSTGTTTSSRMEGLR